MCLSLPRSLLTLPLTLSKFEFLVEGGNLLAEIAPNSQLGGIKYFIPSLYLLVFKDSFLSFFFFFNLSQLCVHLAHKYSGKG